MEMVYPEGPTRVCCVAQEGTQSLAMPVPMVQDAAMRTRARRTRTTSASTADGFGAALASARQAAGLTQAELSDRCGVSRSHVSRLESGDRSRLSLDLIARLEAELRTEGKLYAAAQVVPPSAAAVLAPLYLALQPTELRRTTSTATRRIHLARVAARFLAAHGKRDDYRVDVEALVTATGVDLMEDDGQKFAVVLDTDKVTVVRPIDRDDPRWMPRRRFVLAHAAAHVILGSKACSYPLTGADEDPATDLAAYLIAPSDAVQRAFDAVRGETDGWAPGRPVVETVASRLAVPVWVALRRLAEEDLLTTLAEEEM